MRLSLVAILLLSISLVPLAFAQELLGADDTDKKHAEMESQDPVPVPASVRDLKQKARMLKSEMNSEKVKMRAVKLKLKDPAVEKAEKKILRKEYNGLKTMIHTLKSEISETKAEIGIAKTSRKEHKKQNKGKKHGGGKKHKNGGKKSRAEVDREIAEMTKEEKREMRRQNKRQENNEERAVMKPERKQGGRKSNLSGMIKLRSRTPHAEKKAKKFSNRRGHRIRCAEDKDCKNGATCMANKKGRKFCRGNGMDKPVGKKCIRSEQCMRGLKCYILNDAPLNKHGKRKGVCMSPDKVDLTKGTLLEFKKH